MLLYIDSSFIVQQPEKKVDAQAPKSSPLDTTSIMSWHSSFNEGNSSDEIIA